MAVVNVKLFKTVEAGRVVVVCPTPLQEHAEEYCEDPAEHADDTD